MIRGAFIFGLGIAVGYGMAVQQHHDIEELVLKAKDTLDKLAADAAEPEKGADTGVEDDIPGT